VGLSTIITAVVADLAVTLPGVTVASRVGERWAATHEDAPPRLVWAPKQDSFGAPENNSENPRQLWTCATRVVVHVWGAEDGSGGFGPTETLKNALLASLYRVCHGYVDLVGGAWASEDGRIGDHGQVYLLELEFRIPITDVALTETDVDQIDQTEDLNP
jgi:hypothetical protein